MGTWKNSVRPLCHTIFLSKTKKWCRCDDYFKNMKTMLYLILNDLHWEVRVNALSYWSDVIDCELELQGMIDGIFPPVTFARESKKIITLNRAEVQKRLHRALESMSKNGCLNALVAALLDDFDREVVEKASQVGDSALKRKWIKGTNLMNCLKVVLKLVRLLRDYQLLPVGDPSMSKKRKCSPERKQGRMCSTRSVNPNVSFFNILFESKVWECFVLFFFKFYWNFLIFPFNFFYYIFYFFFFFLHFAPFFFEIFGLHFLGHFDFFSLLFFIIVLKFFILNFYIFSL